MTTDRFEIYGEPVDFIECREVAEGFPRSCADGRCMRFRMIRRDRPMSPFAARATSMSGTPPGSRGQNWRKSDPSRNVMEEVCDFQYEFIDWYTDRNPSHFCVPMLP